MPGKRRKNVEGIDAKEGTEESAEGVRRRETTNSFVSQTMEEKILKAIHDLYTSTDNGIRIQISRFLILR